MLLCPWNSSGKNTGVGSHSLLQGIFLIHGLNPCLLHCRQILYCLEHQRSPSLEESFAFLMSERCIRCLSYGIGGFFRVSLDNFSDCSFFHLGIASSLTCHSFCPSTSGFCQSTSHIPLVWNSWSPEATLWVQCHFKHDFKFVRLPWVPYLVPWILAYLIITEDSYSPDKAFTLLL